MPDPATVPMGTDAEAGGAPPTEQERALDAKLTPDCPEDRRRAPGPWIYMVLVGLIAIALVAIVVTALP